MMESTITPIRPLDEAAALEWLRGQPDGRTTLPAAELARRWGWHRQRAGRRLDAWAKAGKITRRGNTVSVAEAEPVTPSKPKPVTRPARVTPPVTPHVTPRHATDVIAYTAAIALATAAAWFSIRGMVVLFPGSPLSVIGMAVAMESAKLVTAGWLARRWRLTAWVWRLVLVVLVAGLAIINAAGVYAQLVAAHVGERGAATSAIETQDAALAVKIEVAADKVADLDRQIAQIDSAVAAATAKGKATTGLTAMEGQRKARAGLAGEREKAAGALVTLKAERAGVAAKGRQAETEAAPIVYVAEMLGVGTDSERAIRWLIGLMVLCCDPLAIALTAAASARRS